MSRTRSPPLDIAPRPMTPLTPSQRSALYTTVAAQWGIHTPLLAALAQVQGQPQLPQGGTGLGMTPAGSMPLAIVQDLTGQVQAAAQTLRHLLDYLEAWEHLGSHSNLWEDQRGTYTAAFLQRVAQGYDPNRTEPYRPGTTGLPPTPLEPAPASAPTPLAPLIPALAQLEPCNALALSQAYDHACAQERHGWHFPEDWSWLDGRLQQICQRLPRFYRDLNFQQEAILSAAQVWFGFPDRALLLAHWHHPSPLDLPRALFQFLQTVVETGGDRPHFSPPQREALLLLVQRWHQWPSRAATLQALDRQDLPTTPRHTLDPALLAFVQRIPQLYRRSGNQREALTDCFRLWQGYHSRVDSLIALGLSPQVFVGETIASTALQQATLQVDRALLRFIRHIPHQYQGHDRQRQALLTLVQRWESIATQVQTIDFLVETIKTVATLPPHRPESLPAPPSLAPAAPPRRWTPHNLDLHSPIIPDSPLTWAEATAGGLYWPSQEETLMAMLGLAAQLQSAIDRLGRPLQVVRWYHPPVLPTEGQPATHPPARSPDSDCRHALGDAVLGYVTGLQGSQIYSFLDPWWPGGLAWSQEFPLLIYLDNRGYRVRWPGTLHPPR